VITSARGGLRGWTLVTFPKPPVHEPRIGRRPDIATTAREVLAPWRAYGASAAQNP
jgi:hypothetical protein